MISETAILYNLSTRNFGRKIYSFDSIDSTNTFAKSLVAENSPHGTLVIAEEQTAGKGRLGRQWHSEKGANLLMSLILRPTTENEKLRLLPFVASLAVSDAIEQETALSAECKWPNDLLIQGKKVCGILMETSIQEGTIREVILGIGVNVNQKIFNEELAPYATSLYHETSSPVDRIRLLQKILGELERRFEQLERFPVHFILEEWKRRTTMFGKSITVQNPDTSVSALAIGITDEGALVVQTEDGKRRNIFAGDVSIRL